MELRDAIEQISTIRTQLAATERLRCLRAVPVASSGAAAVLAALLQPWVAPAPLAQPARYLLLWCGAAVASALIAAFFVARRVRRSAFDLDAANARLAALQFTPCLVAGAAVTTFVAAELPGQLWLLPGLWQLLFGLGNLAAHRLLPAPASLIGAMFVASGTCCLWFGELALQPWAMGLPFAAGQVSLAALLWWHHERPGRIGARP